MHTTQQEDDLFSADIYEITKQELRAEPPEPVRVPVPSRRRGLLGEEIHRDIMNEAKPKTSKITKPKKITKKQMAWEKKDAKNYNPKSRKGTVYHGRLQFSSSEAAEYYPEKLEYLGWLSFVEGIKDWTKMYGPHIPPDAASNIVANWLPFLSKKAKGTAKQASCRYKDDAELAGLDGYWTSLDTMFRDLVAVANCFVNVASDTIPVKKRQVTIKRELEVFMSWLHNSASIKNIDKVDFASRRSFENMYAFMETYGPVRGKRECLNYASVCSMARGMSFIAKVATAGQETREEPKLADIKTETKSIKLFGKLMNTSHDIMKEEDAGESEDEACN